MLPPVSFLAVSNSLILVNCKKCIFRISQTLLRAGFVIYYYENYSHSFIHSFNQKQPRFCFYKFLHVIVLIIFPNDPFASKCYRCSSDRGEFEQQKKVFQIILIVYVLIHYTDRILSYCGFNLNFYVMW